MWAAKWVDMKAAMLCARGRVTFECNNKLASLSVYISLCFPLWVCVWNRAQRVCRVEMRELSAGGGKEREKKKKREAAQLHKAVSPVSELERGQKRNRECVCIRRV